MEGHDLAPQSKEVSTDSQATREHEEKLTNQASKTTSRQSRRLGSKAQQWSWWRSPRKVDPAGSCLAQTLLPGLELRSKQAPSAEVAH